ncbi:hypothetical protein ACLOJK_041959 [Asimina triloba]
MAFSHTDKICSADFNSYRRKDGQCSRMNAYSEVRWGLGIKGHVEQKKRLEEERGWREDDMCMDTCIADANVRSIKKRLKKSLFKHLSGS